MISKTPDIDLEDTIYLSVVADLINNEAFNNIDAHEDDSGNSSVNTSKLYYT